MITNLMKKIYRRYFKKDVLDELLKNGLTIGVNFNMQEGVIIDYCHAWHITIGDHVTLAPRVHILAHDASTIHHLGYARIGKVNIGNKVFIGASSIILPGVTIGDNVVIGAGSIISKDIPSNSVAIGCPAKVVQSISTFIENKKEEMKNTILFEDEYTMRRGITQEMKNEMNLKMKTRIGYVR